MDKVVYFWIVSILFAGIVAVMWFLPIGRDLDADKEFLHQSPLLGNISPQNH